MKLGLQFDSHSSFLFSQNNDQIKFPNYALFPKIAFHNFLSICGNLDLLDVPVIFSSWCPEMTV